MTRTLTISISLSEKEDNFDSLTKWISQSIAEYNSFDGRKNLIIGVSETTTNY